MLYTCEVGIDPRAKATGGQKESPACAGPMIPSQIICPPDCRTGGPYGPCSDSRPIAGWRVSPPRATREQKRARRKTFRLRGADLGGTESAAEDHSTPSARL